MTTIEMRRPDARQSLAEIFGVGQDVPGLAMPAAQSLPIHNEFGHAVMRACSHDALQGVIAECRTAEGAPAAGMFLSKLPALKLGGDGLCAFKGADGQVVTELDGIIVRAKPYRMLWATDGTKMRPGCGSADSRWGYGVPGGDCATCAEKTYRGQDIQYCRSKTRVYVVTQTGELTVLELTAMAREGLKGAIDYARHAGLQHCQIAFRLGLKLHPRNRPDAKGLNRATILTWQPIARLGVIEGYQQAVDYAQRILGMAEIAWAEDIGEMGDGNATVDTDDDGPVAPPVAPAPVRQPIAPTPPPAPGQAQYGFGDDNVDVDSLPF